MPHQLLYVLRKCLVGLVSAIDAVSSVLLMLSGDIESNPGPRTNAAPTGSDSAKITEIFEVVKGLETNQARFLQEIQVVKEQQNVLNTSVQALLSRVNLLETDMRSLKQIDTLNAASAPCALDALRHDMMKLRRHLIARATDPEETTSLFWPG